MFFYVQDMDGLKDMKEIKHIKVEKDMKVSELVDGMAGMGFGASKIAEASAVLKKMFAARKSEEEGCKVFLGIANTRTRYKL